MTSTKYLKFPLLFTLVLALVAMPALAQELETVPMETTPEGAEYFSGRILVQFAPSVSDEMIETVATQRGCTVEGEEFAGFHVLTFPEEMSEIEMAETFAADPDCEWASPDFVFRPHSHTAFPIPPNDPFYGFQTHLSLIDVEGAWATTIGDEDVAVAVIDSGVAYENRPIPPNEAANLPAGQTDYVLAPDLAQTHFVPGFDFFNNDPYANDDRNHGTSVTATITQDTNNGLRTAGVAPGVTIMPIKVTGFTNSGPFSALINGLAFALANADDIDVINMSLGFSAGASDPAFDFFFVPLDDLLDALHAEGVVIVSSTGNGGVGVVSRPALNPNVIAVGSSNLDGLTRSGYSQFSSIESIAFATPIPPTPGLPGSVEIVAPVGDFTDKDGNGIPDGVVQESFFTNQPSSGFATLIITGTSFASPQVAAVAALMVSEGLQPSKDGLGVDVIRQILRDTSTDLGPAGYDLEFGAGQLDAAAAVSTTKVDVCHRPPGNPANAKTINIGLSAVKAHVNNHGDTLGACP